MFEVLTTFNDFNEFRSEGPKENLIQAKFCDFLWISMVIDSFFNLFDKSLGMVYHNFLK